MNVKQTVPALTAEPAAASDGERNRELPGRPTVLVVDDEERNRLFLRPVLHKHYRIVEADCGPKALGILKTQVIDLVLLDVMMPEMTGFEACKLIKDQYRNHDEELLLRTRAFLRLRAQDSLIRQQLK